MLIKVIIIVCLSIGEDRSCIQPLDVIIGKLLASINERFIIHKGGFHSVLYGRNHEILKLIIIIIITVMIIYNHIPVAEFITFI